MNETFFMNVCYMNAIVQCIFAIPEFQFFVTEGILNRANLDEGSATLAIKKTYEKLMGENEDEDAAIEIRNLFWDNRQFPPEEQSDAHEALLYLLNRLFQELRGEPSLILLSSIFSSHEKNHIKCCNVDCEVRILLIC